MPSLVQLTPKSPQCAFGRGRMGRPGVGWLIPPPVDAMHRNGSVRTIPANWALVISLAVGVVARLLIAGWATSKRHIWIVDDVRIPAFVILFAPVEENSDARTYPV